MSVMQRRESRADLPWPVAPILTIPALSKELKLPEVIDRLDRWYGELDHWLHIWRKRNATFFRRLPKTEEQARLLLRRADDYLPDGVHAEHGFEKPSTLAETILACGMGYGPGLGLKRAWSIAQSAVHGLE